MALIELIVFNFIRNNIVMIVLWQLSYECAFKKNIKIGDFSCSHFNIEDERRHATFLVYYALLFQDSQKHNGNFF